MGVQSGDNCWRVWKAPEKEIWTVLWWVSSHADWSNVNSWPALLREWVELKLSSAANQSWNSSASWLEIYYRQTNIAIMLLSLAFMWSIRPPRPSCTGLPRLANTQPHLPHSLACAPRCLGHSPQTTHGLFSHLLWDFHSNIIFSARLSSILM